MQMQEIMQFVSAHPILSLAWIALFFMLITTTIKGRFSKIKEISHDAATGLINKENALIVDTRSHDDYRKGHIANAINITTADLKNGNLAELEKYKSIPVIVACTNGLNSQASGEYLIKAGFERVYALKDGIAGWSAKNLPLTHGK